MPNFTLTVIDTPGIQSYIFGSNRLRENIGASELVWRATEQWPLDVLHAEGDANVRDGKIVPNLRMEDGTVAAELIYAGGGNVLILFRDLERAKRFATALSRRVLEAAPGLELAVAHIEVDWAHLADGVDAAMKALARAKNSRQPSAPLPGLSVTAACESTGLVATGMAGHRGDEYPVSDAVRAKLEMADEAEKRLQAIFSTNLRFPRDFEEFGEPGEHYLAVVHADGNGMGQFFRNLGKKHRADPRAYIEAVRAASEAVERAATQALRELGSVLLTPGLEGKNQFRPLVFGGDDVTFVCDGRLGLTLTACYLEAFEQATQAESVLGELHACAGIAVVKTHYPFARAYRLSEELARNAKKHVRDGGRDASALDWHFAATGLLGNLQDIRKREYRVGAGDLTLRPLYLRDAPDRARTWPAFVRVIGEFYRRKEEQRNKIIALREALREGPAAVQRYRQSFAFDLPELDSDVDDWHKTGWHGGRCGYFDAVEALDFYTPLTGGDDANL